MLELLKGTLIYKGGPIMVFLILLSVVGWIIAIAKILQIFRISRNTNPFTEKIFAFIENGDISSARLESSKLQHPIARMFSRTLSSGKYSKDEIKELLERNANLEIRNMERYLGGLITIIGVAPLLGFLGTIMGLIKAFMVWEKLGTDITVEALSAGIYQAMITTAAGLMIAIPLYLVYQLLVGRIKSISESLSDNAENFAEKMEKSRFKIRI